MTKSELRQLIKEILKEELTTHKSLKENAIHDSGLGLMVIVQH